ATVASVALLTTSVLADIPKCGPGSPCPESAPCCSQYGQCGVGAYCLGGCDPLFSHSMEACVPNPACKSADYQFKSLSDVASISKYLGDPSKANWVSSGNPAAYGDSILLTMAPDTVGTLMATTKYVWYGKISATMTTSQGAGVVTAFIMMSDVKDEIDFEFVGVDLDHAQSNFYSQGVTNYNNGKNLTVTNTVENVHTYTIDWQPDHLDWIVDGKILRTLKRQDTWNSTSNRFDYPQTPSRVMLSLWPAGLPSNGEGTIKWSGGLVDWNSPLMQNGYYYAMVKSVNVECYDPPSGAQIQGSKAYIYTDEAATNNTVQMVDKVVVLKSLYASGENPDFDPNASASGSSPSSTPSLSAETVPGVVGAGERSGEDSSGGSGSTNSDPSGNTQSGDSSGSSGTGSGGSTGFSQGGSSAGGNSGASSDKMVKGSVFAVVVAAIALLA
ncbi:hypothetical protein P152DRAFT_381702, partial [Eremomyces bilateralis CBS 781.70]